MTFRYRAFGLSIASDFPIPELEQVDDLSLPDVKVRRSPVEVRTGNHELAVAGATATLTVDEIATTFQMIGGGVLLIDCPVAEVGRDVRLYLLGSALGALLHQRRLLPLHACGVRVGSRAYAFMGHSGAGKSTLAAWLVESGAELLSDDVTVARRAENGFTVTSGIPRLRLWRDALESRGLETGNYPRSHSDMDKYDVPVAHAPDAGQVPLAGLFLLEPGAATVFTPLAGSEAVEALSANTYRGSFLRKMGLSADHFEQCIALARSVPLTRFERPLDLARLDETGAALLRWIDQAA